MTPADEILILQVHKSLSTTLLRLGYGKGKIKDAATLFDKHKHAMDTLNIVEDRLKELLRSLD